MALELLRLQQLAILSLYIYIYTLQGFQITIRNPYVTLSYGRAILTVDGSSYQFRHGRTGKGAVAVVWSGQGHLKNEEIHGFRSFGDAPLKVLTTRIPAFRGPYLVSSDHTSGFRRVQGFKISAALNLDLGSSSRRSVVTIANLRYMKPEICTCHGSALPLPPSPSPATIRIDGVHLQRAGRDLEGFWIGVFGAPGFGSFAISTEGLHDHPPSLPPSLPPFLPPSLPPSLSRSRSHLSLSLSLSLSVSVSVSYLALLSHTCRNKMCLLI